MERHAWKMHMVILTLKWSHVLINSAALHQMTEFVVHLLHLALGEWTLHANYERVANVTRTVITMVETDNSADCVSRA